MDRDLVRGDRTCLNKNNSNTEEQEILSKWTEYCSELNNHVSYGGNAVLYNSEPPGDDLYLLLLEKAEAAVAALKKVKTARVDNIPEELVQTD